LKDDALVTLIFGHSGAGKTSILNYYRNQGVIGIEVSDIAHAPDRSLIKSLDWKNIPSVVEQCYTTFGRRFFAEQILKELSDKKYSHAKIVISGIRIIEEAETISEQFSTNLIGIFASFGIRYSRLRKRGKEASDELILRRLFERDAYEAKWGLYDLFLKAGFENTIFTDHLTIDDLHNQLNSRNLFPK
jgi:dephospho-CoA kinase